jgi:hypothetical protein
MQFNKKSKVDFLLFVYNQCCGAGASGAATFSWSRKRSFLAWLRLWVCKLIQNVTKNLNLKKIDVESKNYYFVAIYFKTLLSTSKAHIIGSCKSFF